MMKNAKIVFLYFLMSAGCFQTFAQNITVTSPDKNITVTISNGDKLGYSVKFKDHVIVNPSQMGFELKGEPSLDGNFNLVNQKVEKITKPGSRL